MRHNGFIEYVGLTTAYVLGLYLCFIPLSIADNESAIRSNT